MPMIGCKGFEINVGMLTETSNESALSLSLSLSLLGQEWKNRSCHKFSKEFYS